MVKRQQVDLMEKVLVIGGLGFIGYHLVNSLFEHGYNVTVSSRTVRESSKYNYPIVQLDLLEMIDDQISKILAPFDHIVFAGGSDDRNIPKGDAYDFFYQGNVAPCKKLARLCSKLKTQKLIILGSYFSHFNRVRPEWRLTEKHPYVLSRSLQLSESLEVAQGKVAVSTIEIPYVFGAAPGLIPLWNPLIKYISSWPIVFYTKGGTNIIAVEQLAKAITSVIQINQHRKTWTVGGVNVSWREMIHLIANALSKKKKVIIVPTFLLRGFAKILSLYFALTNKEPGLDPYQFLDVQTSNTYLDTKESQEILAYGETDIEKAVQETVEACAIKS